MGRHRPYERPVHRSLVTIGCRHLRGLAGIRKAIGSLKAIEFAVLSET